MPRCNAPPTPVCPKLIPGDALAAFSRSASVEIGEFAGTVTIGLRSYTRVIGAKALSMSYGSEAMLTLASDTGPL